jgi:hypothetical protein
MRARLAKADTRHALLDALSPLAGEKDPRFSFPAAWLGT